MRFRVYGLPQPKGSTRAFFVKKLGRAVITNDNPKTKGWEKTVGIVAVASGLLPEGTVAGGPVEVGLTFFLPRPKGHSNAKLRLLPSAPERHTKKPDLDKLARAVLDALTGIVWRDDAQVVKLTCAKVFADGDILPGVTIEVNAA